MVMKPIAAVSTRKLLSSTFRRRNFDETCLPQLASVRLPVLASEV
jgi:hypothetical protein